MQELPKVFDYPRLCKAVDDIIKELNKMQQDINDLKMQLEIMHSIVYSKTEHDDD